MNNFWRVILVAVLIAAAFYFCPILFAPLGAIIGITTAVASVIGLVLFAIAGVGVSVIGAFLAVLLVMVVGLSPIWLPILLVFGLIQLLRRDRGTVTTTATPVP